MSMSVGEVWEAFGGAQSVAELLGVTVQAVSNMKSREAIPPRHWHPLVAEAAKRRLKGITFDVLAAIKPPARRKSSPTSRTAGAHP